ncbi:PP2C family serine/threonine-protein phosphatase [Sphaerimonospora thailandensis]|uniref:PPM-type phosphatase domain-containing protein n=1 Tax=Sphaerimonospora thailandensis TaxID=795644 RepID=A0A8J3W0K1_9ACTN|nr:PP2C family serine/threonine-protein phosphatase [Sphaerimonospora thailandensis]GIH72319.1 hypothetical protein Mth01_45720 [Sphaerimonospora thailandensis]
MSAWRVQGLSLPGYSHMRSGLPCQDAHRHAILEKVKADGPVVVLAVADGAGSRSRSAEGAEMVVSLAVAAVEEALSEYVPADGEAWKELLCSSFQAVLTRFHDHATQLADGHGADDFATTLTVAVLSGEWLGIASLGDGFVVVRTEEPDGPAAAFHLVTQPPVVGEYSNQTVFVTSAGALESLYVCCIQDACVTGLMLSTDGLAQPALRWADGVPRRPNTSFAKGVLDFAEKSDADPRALAQLLLSDDVVRRNADDKTLLLAVRG